MKKNKKDRLFEKTDYLIEEVNVLTVLGAIPAEFVTFHPDGGIEIDYFITSFMEYFPRKTLGEHWIVAIYNSIRYACAQIKFNIADPDYVFVGEEEKLGAGFQDTSRLALALGMPKSKLDSLVGWAIKQNPDLFGFMMQDRQIGYVVSSFLLDQLEKVGLRLDEFLKSIVGGKTRFEVN